ncbi:MAG: domain-like, partial [Chloroflexi bacterium]|nr:domain-like [Chloroflexota bacterium]
PVSAEVARLAGQIRGRLMARGRVRTQADMMIAATAQIHHLVIVTRNTRDFEDCGVPVLNPFTP